MEYKKSRHRQLFQQDIVILNQITSGAEYHNQVVITTMV